LTNTTTSQTLNMMTEPVLISDYYHFYEDNNRNGLMYDIAIDNTIINLLNNENKVNRKKLKSEVESSIQRKISPSTFQSHLSISWLITKY
jgi:hypothetical protein